MLMVYVFRYIIFVELAFKKLLSILIEPIVIVLAVLAVTSLIPIQNNRFADIWQ